MTNTKPISECTVLLRTLECHGWVWLILVATGSQAMGYPAVAAGFLVGGVISVLNFRWLCFFYQRALLQKKRRAKILASLAYVARYAFIGALLYVTIQARLTDLVALVLGLSLMVAIIPSVGLWLLRHGRLGQFEAN